MTISLSTPSLKAWTFGALLSMASLSAPAQAAPTAAAAAQVSQLYEFSYPISVQNLVALPNGCLLLSTSANADLHYIDPEALYPAAQKVTTLTGATALTGFAALGDGFYAVSGSASSSAEKKSCTDDGSSNSMQIYVVKVDTEGDVNVTVDHSIAVPNTSSMEGMVALPEHPRTVLSADAIGGRILRIDTDAKTVDVAFENDALKPNDDGATHGGVTGIKIRDGHLYFTNAATGTFGRFPIDASGKATGDVELLASMDGPEAYGDFGFDGEGNAYVAVHPSSVYKITPAREQTLLAGGAKSMFLGPTSAVVSNDGKSVYVSTAGEDTGFPISGGQVIKVLI